MTTGLFIGRLNPPHLGHIKIIEKSLNENDLTIIMLGTQKDIDNKNPLSFEQRKYLLEKKFSEINNLIILKLDDNPSDEVWINDINNFLLKYSYNKENINFYGGDFKNDSAYNTIKEYDNLLSYFNFNYVELFRGDIFIEHNGENHNISATKVRKLHREGDLEFLYKLCDDKICEEIALILGKC